MSLEQVLQNLPLAVLQKTARDKTDLSGILREKDRSSNAEGTTQVQPTETAKELKEH